MTGRSTPPACPRGAASRREVTWNRPALGPAGRGRQRRRTETGGHVMKRWIVPVGGRRGGGRARWRRACWPRSHDGPRPATAQVPTTVPGTTVSATPGCPARSPSTASASSPGMPDTVTVNLGVSVDRGIGRRRAAGGQLEGQCAHRHADRRRRGQDRHPDRLRQRLAALRQQPDAGRLLGVELGDRRHPRREPGRAGHRRRHRRRRRRHHPRRRVVLDRRHQRPVRPGPPEGGRGGQDPGRAAGPGGGRRPSAPSCR